MVIRCIYEHTVYGNGVLVYLLAEAASASEQVRGGVNADGGFTVLDVVMLRKWLLCTGEITDWQAGDLCENGRLDAFDLSRMKRELLN
ncbi:MAG: hypothetical protein E7504_04435 [Ruminococcus sp.]|nr:hypothetical protein [Ruminococcus sp.]